MESNGLLEGQQRTLSERALKRGELALGTLGSGNHFLELQVVDQILDPEAAKAFGLRKGQVTAMIHTGLVDWGTKCAQITSMLWSGITRKVQPVGMQKSGTSHCPIGSWPRPLSIPRRGKPTLKRYRRLEIHIRKSWSIDTAVEGRITGTSGDRWRFEVIYDVSHNIAKSNNMSFMGPIAIAVYTEKVPLEH